MHLNWEIAGRFAVYLIIGCVLAFLVLRWLWRGIVRDEDRMEREMYESHPKYGQSEVARLLREPDGEYEDGSGWRTEDEQKDVA